MEMKKIRIFLSSSNELSNERKNLENEIANVAKQRDYFNSSTLGKFVHKYVSFWLEKQTCIYNQLISNGHSYHSKKMQIEYAQNNT